MPRKSRFGINVNTCLTLLRYRTIDIAEFNVCSVIFLVDGTITVDYIIHVY